MEDFWIEVLDEVNEWSAGEVGGYHGLVSWRCMTKCRRKMVNTSDEVENDIQGVEESIVEVGNFGRS